MWGSLASYYMLVFWTEIRVMLEKQIGNSNKLDFRIPSDCCKITTVDYQVASAVHTLEQEIQVPE